mgnify:CR=1 FL=1|jgi:hypothetical protein
MAAKATKEKAPVETPVTPSEAHEEPLAEVKEAAATGETESGDSEPLTEVKEEALTEVKEEATREAGPGDSEPPAEAKEEAPAAPVYDYEVLPHNRDGATEEQIAMAKKVLDQNADIPAVYIVGGLYLSEEWRADRLSENGEHKVTVRRIIKEKGS